MVEKCENQAWSATGARITVDAEQAKKVGISHLTSKIIQKTKLCRPYLGRIPLWIFPLLVSILFFHLRGVLIYGDSIWYLNSGLNLYQGLGYLERTWKPVTMRGPIFSGLIALSFGLFGVSFKSALWVVRLFFVLNVGLVYAMATRLFNRPTALIATGLILTSFTVHQWSSYIYLDNIVPFFILLAQLLLFMAFEEQKRLYFGLAGAALGVAYLTKSIAIFFVPWPFLLWLWTPAYRKRKFWSGILIFWAGVLFVTLPWFVHLFSSGTDPTQNYIRVSNNFTQLLSTTNEGTSAGSLPSAGLWVQLLGNPWPWLNNYYQDYLVANFVLAPFFLLAWAYILFRAIFKKQSHPEKILVSGLIFFLPIIFIQRTVGLRAGQSFYLFLLSYLALARLLWIVAHYVSEKIVKAILTKQVQPSPLVMRLQQKIPDLAVIFISVLAIASQIWLGNKAFIHILKDYGPAGIVQEYNDVWPYHFYAMSFGQDDWEVTFSTDPVHKDAALLKEASEWLAKNSNPGDTIMTHWTAGNLLYFYLGARQPNFSSLGLTFLNTESLDQGELGTILFIWPNRDLITSTTSLIAVSESRLLSQIQTRNTKYIVVNPDYNFLSLYLEANPGFEKVKQFGAGQIKIFRIRNQLRPIPFPTYIEPKTGPYLEQLVRNNPQQYQHLMNNLVKLGIKETMMEQMLADGNISQFGFEVFEFGQIY